MDKSIAVQPTYSYYLFLGICFQPLFRAKIPTPVSLVLPSPALSPVQMLTATSTTAFPPQKNTKEPLPPEYF